MDLVVSNAAGHTYYFENTGEIVSAKDESFSQETLAYPNPTSGNIRLEMPWSKKATTIQLYSASGQLLQRLETLDQQADISLQSLPAGLYVVQLIGQEGTATRKIWKL
jgi:hypothetical protein